MTHSLHRTGTAESLRNDYVFLATPSVGINHEGSKPKLQKMLEIIYELEPANIGSLDVGTIFSGATYEEIKQELSDKPRVRCVFSDLGKIRELLRRIKEEDFGLSIVVSGLVDEVIGVARELGICPHSVNLSLGVHGRIDKLPSEAVLKFMTMCGHGVISGYLVDKLIEEVKAGRRTPRNAARRMARPCVCGIFNQERAEEILNELAAAADGTPV